MNEPQTPTFLVPKHPLHTLNQNVHQSSTSTSHTFIKNKLSLQTCGSSISIEEQLLHRNKHREERRLFMKFLSFYGEKRIESCRSTVEEMVEMKRSLNLTDFNSRGLQLRIPSLVKQKSEQYENKVFCHFGRIWLDVMGHLTEKNKKFIINQALVLMDSSKLSKIVEFYESLGSKYMNEEERVSLILQTCLNGWQYFIKKMCEFVEQQHEKQLLQHF